jgi:deoxycytidine triphosphate deaminase
MQPLSGKQMSQRLQGVIQEKYQVHGYSVDLTVRHIYAVDPIGRVDFGGNEYRAAGKMPVATHRQRPEDRYAWWDLGRGCYFVEFNETLELGEDEIALLEPDERLMRAGAAHEPIFLRGRAAPIETLLQVETMRLQVKQNARISHLRLFRFDVGEPLGTAPAARPARKPARRRGKAKRGKR